MMYYALLPFIINIIVRPGLPNEPVSVVESGPKMAAYVNITRDRRQPMSGF